MGFESWGLIRVNVNVVGMVVHSLWVSLSLLLCRRVSCVLASLFVSMFVCDVVVVVLGIWQLIVCRMFVAVYCSWLCWVLLRCFVQVVGRCVLVLVCCLPMVCS